MKKTFKFLSCLFVAILCFGQMWGTTQTIGFTTATCSKEATSGGERSLTNVTNLTVAHELVSTTSGALATYTKADKEVELSNSTTKGYSRGGYKWNVKTGSTLGTSNNTVGFSVEVGSGKQFTVDSISFAIGASANMVYQVIIYQGSDTLYKSSELIFTRGNSTANPNYSLTVRGLSAQSALQNLTGTFYVRARFAFNSTGKYFFLPAFTITGDLHDESSGDTPAVDETAPTLSSSSPANSATGVAVSGTIVLTFSEAIASVDGSKFSLSGATIGTVAIDGTDATKVNVPYSGASNSATVTLSVAADAVADAAGNKSAALSDISFTTVAAETPVCPSGMSISGTQAYTEGETISLTAALSAGNGEITYNWYKGTDLTAAKAAGSIGTGTSYSKANCVTGDAGNYFCVATKADCSEVASSAYAVTVETVSYCAELVPATSGSEIAVNDVIDLQTGSNGGTMTAINLGSGNLAYNTNGLGFNSKGGPTVKVVLKHNMQVGTKLWIKLMAAGADTRGLTLKTKTGSTISAFTCWVKDVNGATNGDVETFTYTVVASDGLEGTNEFQLARNNSVWLQSVKVSNCGEELCAATIPGDIEKGEASGGTGKIVLKVEEDGEPEDGDAWYWQSSASGEAKTDEYNAEDGKEVSAAGTYYLRSYNTADDCWSDAKSVTVDAEDLLTTPTATFSNGAYVVNASALDLSTLWSSNSNGTVTYALKETSDDASVTAGAFSATKAGSYVVTASQAATSVYEAIEKEATITVTYPATGTATVSYALSGSTVTGTVTGVSTISSLSSSLTLSTLTLSGTKDGYSGAIKGCTSTTELVEDDYVDVQFTVADGYMFTPSAVTVQVNPFTATGAVKAVVKIMDDQPLVVASEVLACAKSTDNTATFASGAFTNKRFVETVHIRMYFYGPAVDKTFYIKSPISITGTVAEYAEPVGFEISTSATNGTIATSVSGVTVSSAEANDQVDIVATPSTGYQFSSWSIYETATPANTITPAASTASTSFTMPSAEVTVEATFSKIDYTVTYNAATNGSYTIKVGTADAVSANTTAQYGQTVTLAATPNTGYALSAWSVTGVTSSDNITVTNNQFTMPAENVTVSATFIEAYTLSYNKNGGSGDAMDNTVGAGSVTLRKNSYTKDGYVFIGWATSVDNAAAGTVAYLDGASYTLSANAELFAVWSPESYSFTPATSGDNPAVNATISSSTGGTMKYTPKDDTADLIAYASQGLFFQSSSKCVVTITLDKVIKEGSVFTVVLTNAGDTKSGRGIKLNINNSDKATWTWDPAGANEEVTFQWTVPADDNAIGKKEFKLIRVGNAYLKSLTVTNTAEPTPDYTRLLTAGRFGTICLPNGGTIEGAAIYEIVYKEASQIFFDEVDGGVMIAGRPYIFYPYSGSTELKVYYTDNLNADAGNYNGLYGSYEATVLTPDDGNYILYNNMYYLVNSTASVGANRAYIKLGEVPDQPQAPTPGRRRISMQVQGEQIATGIIDAENAQQPMKVMIDNRLYIIRAGKMYDMTGSKVK